MIHNTTEKLLRVDDQHEVASLLYIKLPIWLSTFRSFPDKLYDT